MNEDVGRRRIGGVSSSDERRRDRFSDRGSASIWVLTFTALVLLAGLLTLTVTALGAGHARAAAAADLVALTAAQHLADGSACSWARQAARRNAATVSDCRPGAADVTVTVTVPVRLPLWSRASVAFVSASSRAGRTASPTGSADQPAR